MVATVGLNSEIENTLLELSNVLQKRKSDVIRDAIEFYAKNIKKDKKARFQGYNFYFKEGFSWSDIHTIEIKSRLKSGGVYDVTSMSLFSVSNLFSDKFFITILNSSLISDYSFSFVNNTPHFQINDARQIPIIVPTSAQLKEFEKIFDKAKKIKIEEFSSKITKEEAKQKLDELQKIVDKAVYKLYDIKV